MVDALRKLSTSYACLILHGLFEKLLNTHGIIRFAHPSGRPVGVQCASALVRLKTCRNDEGFFLRIRDNFTNSIYFFYLARYTDSN